MITNETLALLEEMAVFAKVVETGSFSEATQAARRDTVCDQPCGLAAGARTQYPVIAAHDPQAASE